MKTTSKYKKGNISATTGQIVLKFEPEANWIKPYFTKVFKWGWEDKLKKWKVGSDQQPLVISYLNLTPKLMGSNKNVQRFQMKKIISKHTKWNISATTGQIILKFETLANGVKPKVNKGFNTSS